MKKIIAFILMFFMTLSLIGCGGETPEVPDDPEDKPTEEVKPSEIKVSGEKAEINVGEEFDLTIEVLPTDAKDKTVSVTASPSGIVDIKNNKTVKGLKAGEVTITVSAVAAPTVKKEIKLTVKEVVAEPTLELTTKNGEVYLGETLNIESFVKYANTNPGMKVTYTSLNEEVATVDANGVITGKATGTAKIEVALTDSTLKLEFTVTVKENTLEIVGENKTVAGSTIQLTLKVNGKEVAASWNSEETKVATVDANGLVTTITSGSVVISATYNGSTVKTTITVESNSVIPTALNVASDAPSTIYIDTPVKLSHTVEPANASSDVKYKSSNEKIATVDENGNVTFLKGGSVVITVTSKLSSKVNASITLEPVNYIDPIKFFQDYNVGTVSQQYISHISYNIDPYTVSLLSGTISYFYFEDLEIIDTYKVTGKPGTLRKQTLYITVHDTADGADASGVGKGTALWNQQSTDSSWHFSIGNDGIWAGVNEREVAWHAGDGTSTELTWTDTGILATTNEPAKVTISEDGYWELNGVKSELKAPEVPIQHYDGGWKTTGYRTAKTSDLPYTGINTRIGSNGNYQIGSVWWSQSYQTLSNRGGNLNSIGMETAMNESANLEDVWHKTAKLCGDLVTRFNLPYGVKAIKQHNTFSGKDCPATMRAAGRWEYFIQMCEAEWKARKYLQGFDFELICNSPLVNEKGQVIKFPETDTVVEYSVRITNSAIGYDQTVNLQVTVPAAIKK